ncbi:hypothetical protein RMATCC62417_00746 [Rhizopus microsporus]|nr:hypothetical protein RMATCC62417_00746 [Rhizopus microsporus]
MTFIKGPLAVDRGFPSLFAQTQANLFKNTSFEASDDDFQEIPLLRKDKNIRTTLKAVKEDTSAPGPSNVVINEKTSMPAVNKDTSVQTVLPAPTPFTSCISAPIKVSKKYQGKVDKAEALKKEKEKNKTTTNEQKQVRCPSCGGAGHSRSFSKLCSMNKSKTKLSTRRRKEHQECHLDEFKYISELPTLKTANLTSFLLTASTRLQNYQRIHNYYCQDKWSQKLKFKTYTNKQKGTQEIVKRLFDNSKKHGKTSTVGAKNQNPNKSKHVPLPPADLPSSSQQKRINAFGNGSFCSSMKGKRAAPTRRSTDEIKTKCKQSNKEGGSNLFVLTST